MQFLDQDSTASTAFMLFLEAWTIKHHTNSLEGGQQRAFKSEEKEG